MRSPREGHWIILRWVSFCFLISAPRPVYPWRQSGSVPGSLPHFRQALHFRWAFPSELWSTTLQKQLYGLCLLIRRHDQYAAFSMLSQVGVSEWPTKAKNHMDLRTTDISTATLILDLCTTRWTEAAEAAGHHHITVDNARGILNSRQWRLRHGCQFCQRLQWHQMEYLFISFVTPQNNKTRKCLKQTSGITGQRRTNTTFARPKTTKSR